MYRIMLQQNSKEQAYSSWYEALKKKEGWWLADFINGKKFTNLEDLLNEMRNKNPNLKLSSQDLSIAQEVEIALTLKPLDLIPQSHRDDALYRLICRGAKDVTEIARAALKVLNENGLDRLTDLHIRMIAKYFKFLFSKPDTMSQIFVTNILPLFAEGTK